MVRIGILGGIGPEATSEFYRRLIFELQKRHLISSNKDYPQILINSIPAPELVGGKVPRKELKAYLDGLKELDKLDVDFIVMVCNTIYLFFNFLQGQIKTPIIDMRKEVEDYIKSKKIDSVVILGTPSTINQNLYILEGLKVIRPTKNEMEKISKAIFSFNKESSRSKSTRIVRKIIHKYLSRNFHIVLGCTELSLMFNKRNPKIIDTLEIFVDATIKKILKRYH